MTSGEFRAALREIGLSQHQFHLRSGASVSTVNRWANDAQPIPRWVDWVFEMLRERHDIVVKLSAGDKAA